MADDRRVFGLDVLRALAVLSVVYGHGYYLLGDGVSNARYNLPVLPGVTIFFVLSGFLIGRILLRTVAKADFGYRLLAAFWIRRWFRTLPNYFLVLILVVIASRAGDLPLPSALPEYFIFSQNLAWPHPSFFGEAWSLSVEEWFYLCAPIPLYLASKAHIRDRRPLMLAWIIVVILAASAFRIYRLQRFGYSTIDAWDENLRKPVATRLDSLMFGVLGAYLSLYFVGLWKAISVPAFWIGVALLLADKFFSSIEPDLFYLGYFSLTIGPVGALLLLPAMSGWTQRGGWLVRTVTFVSLISYSMYLLNFTPIQGLLLPQAMRMLAPLCAPCAESTWLKYLLFWILTVAGSYLLYRFFERPTTALRDRFRFGAPTVVAAFANPGSRAQTSTP